MKYKDAIRDALTEAMRANPRVIVMGLGVTDPKGVFGSTLHLVDEFGPERVFDIPVAENAVVGIAMGAAMQGLRPVMVNQRIDFLLPAMDQIANHAALWRGMFNGAQPVPIVLRAVVGRGWGQGAQHSKSLHATFAHFPGLRVVAPASGYDVKGMLISALAGSDPVLVIEHRWLYEEDMPVPSGLYYAPLEGAACLVEGRDLTVVAASQMVLEARKSVAALASVGVSAELIDLRSLNPLDTQSVCASVSKTGRLVVADADWKTAGVAAEVVARVAEQSWAALKAPPARVAWPDWPPPTSVALEQAFFPGSAQIYQAALHVLGREDAYRPAAETGRPFLGPY